MPAHTCVFPQFNLRMRDMDTVILQCNAGKVYGALYRGALGRSYIFFVMAWSYRLFLFLVTAILLVSKVE